MSDRITVIHAPHDSSRAYFVLIRAVPQDSQLSFEARGVLTYLLSKPPDWKVQISDLMREGACGRDRIYRILNELRICGYLHRDRIRRADGTFEWGPHRIYEVPFTENADMDAPHQKAAQPLPENPHMAKPDTDYPYTENTEVVKTGKTHQKATQPFTPLPDTENTEILKIVENTDQRILKKREGVGAPVESTSKSTPPLFFEKLADVCRITIALATDRQRRSLGEAASKLYASGATVEQLDRFGAWWDSDSNWRSKKARAEQRKPEAPKPSDVLEEWGNATATPIRKPANGYTPLTERPMNKLDQKEILARLAQAGKKQ